MSAFLRSTGPPGTSNLTASLSAGSAAPANILERVGPVESDSKESSEPAANDSDAFDDISQFQHFNDNLPAVAQFALTYDLTIVECNPEDQPTSALADTAVSGLYAEGTMHEQAMKVTACSSDPADGNKTLRMICWHTFLAFEYQTQRVISHPLQEHIQMVVYEQLVQQIL